jgi:type I restriction-modification system DNA methylase subunit
MANTVFSSKDLKPELLLTFYQGIANREEKIQLIRNWQKAIENGTVHKKKEEQLKGEFLDKFFGQLLGYAYESHEAEWNIEKEFKSISDGKKPDAALGFFGQDKNPDVRCVIEVKGGLIHLDKKQNRADFQGSAVDQAFSYVPRMPGKCTWVIVTNMIEIRFYAARDISRYESFLINELLLADNLQRFFFLLSYNQLFLQGGGSRIDALFMERQAEQKKISTEFYNSYHDLRLALFADLQKSHPKILPKKLFGHTQKLIDRIIFICFVRDRDLVGMVLTDVQDTARKSFSKSKERVWTELKHLFTVMNEGLLESGRDIPEFNGGLFKEDVELNNLHIKNNQLTEIINFVASYDFQSQLDVNILGHIFEQSISDIEEFQARLEGDKTSETQISKRKKDGVYYTPDYITRYIVKEAVGGWLDDRRKEIYDTLKITELPELASEDYETAGRTPNEKIKLHIAFWESYREQLRKIKVLDPACGSGAFLTQVFDYLWKEWEVLMAEWNKLTRPLKEQLRDFIASEPFAVYNGIDEWKAKKNIVANNIFGVDLNPESVEITKLSLWLKTANRKESLADLSGNIKQGNSLIDDPNVAGDDAFDWNKNFAEIMQAGGFDVVVGNPPWGAEIGSDLIKFLKQKYDTAQSELDTYALFIEFGLRILKPFGFLSFITPDTYLRKDDRIGTRKLFLGNSSVKKLIETGPLFSEVRDTWCLIVVLKNEKPTKENNIQHFKLSRFTVSVDQRLDDFANQVWSSVSNYPQLSWLKGKGSVIGYLADINAQKIVSKLSELPSIIESKLFGVSRGEEGGKDKFEENTKGDFYLVVPENIDRYAVRRGLKVSSDFLSKKKINSFYSNPKIWIIRIQKPRWKQRIVCGFDPRINSSSLKTLQIIISNKNDGDQLSLLQAILSSKLINFWCVNFLVDDMNQSYLEKIPLPNLSDKKLTKVLLGRTKEMITLSSTSEESSKTFLELLQSNFPFESPTNKLKKWYDLEFIDLLAELEKAGTKIPAKKQGEWLALFKAEKAKLKTTQAEIDKTDKEIDELVYALYELTPEEIEIVKKS